MTMKEDAMTTKPKFTPGEWKASIKIKQSRQSPLRAHVFGPKDRSINARGVVCGDCNPEDMNLIAAAPDLYAALELGVQNVLRDIASGKFVGDDGHEFLTVAQAALKKARGEA